MNVLIGVAAIVASLFVYVGPEKYAKARVEVLRMIAGVAGGFMVVASL